jgi:YspA, cpYpsA-related SLOG family
MRILVCGGRDYTNYREFETNLCDILFDYVEFERVTIIQGGARGADALAKRFAEDFGDTCIEFKADWEQYGKSAGYIRNKQMLEEGKPDLVVAFPGGNGTASMVALAKKANVEVIEFGT